MPGGPRGHAERQLRCSYFPYQRTRCGDFVCGALRVCSPAKHRESVRTASSSVPGYVWTAAPAQRVASSFQAGQGK